MTDHRVVGVVAPPVLEQLEGSPKVVDLVDIEHRHGVQISVTVVGLDLFGSERSGHGRTLPID